MRRVAEKLVGPGDAFYPVKPPVESAIVASRRERRDVCRTPPPRPAPCCGKLHKRRLRALARRIEHDRIVVT